MTDKLLGCCPCTCRKVVDLTPWAVGTKYPTLNLHVDRLVINDASYNHSSLQINYCPMCGRPLNQDATNRRPEQWVSVGERLPDDKQEVIVRGIDPEAGKYVRTSLYDKGWNAFLAWDDERCDWMNGLAGVTHWMPIPPEVNP